MTSIDKTAGLAIPQPAAYELRAPGDAVARIARAVPWGICAITAVAAALRLAELDDVAGNPFYDAAVRSMSLSLHNLFFGAFDPRGVLAVDKPPLSFWLQVASTKLFGWSSVSLKLPEALGGTLAVPLLYDAVRRVAGRPAGLAAAAALAVLPISVLTARSDTMDSLMMLFVVAALWCTVRAAAEGSRGWLVLAGVAFGLAFNVKLSEALIAAPAVMMIYALAAPVSSRRRAEDIAIATGALVLVALSWAVAATLAPGSHPYVIGSTDGTIYNAMFVWDGVGRAAGMLSTSGAYSAPPGPLRLLSGGPGHLAAMFGSVLVPALALGAAAVLAARRRIGGRDPQQRLRRAFWLAVAVWLVLGLVAFSHVGLLHVRYLEAITPAVALALGGALASLTGLGKGGDGMSARAVALLAVALACVCWYVARFAPTPLIVLAAGFAEAAVAAAILATGVLPSPRLSRLGGRCAAGLALACCLTVPIHVSLSLVRSRTSDSTGLPHQPLRLEAQLARYLGPRTVGARFELASDNAIELAPLMIQHATPVLPLTSFGDRPLVGVSELKRLVRAGAVRYALIGAHRCSAVGAGAACIPAAIWIRQHGVNVSAAVGLAPSLRLSLYLLG